MSDLRPKLEAEVLAASWADLAPHFARQALLLVAPEVDLLDVAVAMASDDVPSIQGWLEGGSLGRPTDAVAEAWSTAAPRFQAVIVQPWVVAQILGPGTAPAPSDA